MNMRLDTWLAACLLAAALLSGCATPSGGAQELLATPTRVAGTPSMSSDSLHDLAALPPDERRRRIDVMLASHPDDLESRVARLKADLDLQDFPALLADSEPVLANSTLSPRRRRWLLTLRAEVLIQARQPTEALLSANQALEIDSSYPEALFARGWAAYLTDHGLAQSALADLDRALQLEPDEGIGYYRRAVILEYQGQFELAASELQHASQLAPNDVPIRQEFGVLLFTEWYSGQFKQSIESFREQAIRPEASLYAPLWLFVMRIRADAADEAGASAELAALAPAHQPHEWIDTLVDLMLGKSTLEAALSEADTAPTDRLRAGRRCEAEYYAAEQMLAHGEYVQASRLLDEGQAVCPTTYTEATAIAAERHRLPSRGVAG